MELQLGLALPSNTVKGFDLNNNYGSYEIKDSFGLGEIKKSKRTFDEAFDTENFDVLKTLPLLVWNNNNSMSDQDDNISDIEPTSSSITINKSEGEESGVVGWPPVKSWRRKLCHQKQNGGGGVLKSMYVKVKMEGVGIARKVDLSLHASYQTLAHTLIGMFGKCQEDVETYKLTYQDKEGDWLLAGDVPWGTFIETVQRLKLVKNTG